MPNSDYLIHYGILGMKWGVRRFETKSGHLTAAGKERYKTDTATAKSKVVEAKTEAKAAKQKFNKASLKDPFIKNEAKDAKQEALKAMDKVSYAKQKLGNEKIKEKLNSETREKSKHRLKLEEKYKSEGMSDEEAEIAAYKRARTEKILAVMGGVAITAAAAYVIKNHYDKNVDRLIKPGTLLQNMAGRSDKGIADAFYFSSNAHDNRRYLGLYGTEIADRGNEVFRSKISVDSAIRVASERSAAEALRDVLASNPSYVRELRNRLGGVSVFESVPKRKLLYSKAMASLDKNVVNGEVYRAFNILLADHTPSTASMQKQFYDTLTAKGYNAIMDVNDKHYSNYHTRSPMIAFNAASKLSIKEVRQIPEAEIAKVFAPESSKVLARTLTKAYAPTIALYSGAFAAIKANKNRKTKTKQDQIVNEYKAEHPNSKLTRTEILNNYYDY